MNATTRFGNVPVQTIKSVVVSSTPKNTTKTKKSIWRQFGQFCQEKNYELLITTPLPEIANILEDWAFNMKKSNGEDYKEYVIKTMWNITAKMVQEKYYNEFKIIFDPFTDIVFQAARNAKNAKRKQIQSNFEKKKQSSTVLNKEEVMQMAMHWDENTPVGLQRKFFLIASYELAWTGSESVQCKTYYFKLEKYNDGSLTDRLEYNSNILQTTQGETKHFSDSKWLTANDENPELCPIRLYKKLVEKRGHNITSDRFFLTPNPFWLKENSKGWYKNMPIGINEISKWMKISAKEIGLDITNKIIDHSHLSTLAKTGVSDQEKKKLELYKEQLENDQQNLQTANEASNAVSMPFEYTFVEGTPFEGLPVKQELIEHEPEEDTFNMEDQIIKQDEMDIPHNYDELLSKYLEQMKVNDQLSKENKVLYERNIELENKIKSILDIIGQNNDFRR